MLPFAAMAAFPPIVCRILLLATTTGIVPARALLVGETPAAALIRTVTSLPAASDTMSFAALIFTAALPAAVPRATFTFLSNTLTLTTAPIAFPLPEPLTAMVPFAIRLSALARIRVLPPEDVLTPSFRTTCVSEWSTTTLRLPATVFAFDEAEAEAITEIICPSASAFSFRSPPACREAFSQTFVCVFALLMMTSRVPPTAALPAALAAALTDTSTRSISVLEPMETSVPAAIFAPFWIVL